MGRQSRVGGETGGRWGLEGTELPAPREEGLALQGEHSPQSFSTPTPCHLTPSSSWDCLEASCRDEVPPTLAPSSAAPQRPMCLVGLMPEDWVFKIKVGQLSSPARHELPPGLQGPGAQQLWVNPPTQPLLHLN